MKPHRKAPKSPLRQGVKALAGKASVDEEGSGPLPGRARPVAQEPMPQERLPFAPQASFRRLRIPSWETLAEGLDFLGIGQKPFGLRVWVPRKGGPFGEGSGITG